MLDRGLESLLRARAEGYAIAAFTTYTLESTRAICTAGERTGLPVVICAGASSYRWVGREQLASSSIAAAEAASTPVGVHLDHSRDLGEIRACIELGYSSVMFDGSSLPYEENVSLTKALADMAHASGVWVEAELGGIGGEEDASTDAVPFELTDPEQARDFVARAGVDALAPAVGTVHGFTRRPVSVDIARVRAIAEATGVPLVLHGGSGLSAGVLAQLIDAGIAKVNINAQLRRSYIDALRHGARRGGDDVAALQMEAIEAMTEAATALVLALRPRTDVQWGTQ
ncbi:MAG TPA: class II fructose-bisphosphate aldolase [Candidatus Saccharimonadales bacterium]|nr:class II fructose-bisphosphate aldolase [Candidatus Saccharimonadales bacterium]